jgi:periodic tryptophan protein 1
VYIYEPEEVNLYVHHDIILPSFPICIEWIGHEVSGTKNTVAIGTFNPDIEIWDLDLMDALTPLEILGGYQDAEQDDSDIASLGKLSAKQRKKKKKKLMQRAATRQLKPGSHSDAVMSLSWNHLITNVLASGSADKSVKLWDLNTQACLNTYTHHTDKVQALCWHPTEAK